MKGKIAALAAGLVLGTAATAGAMATGTISGAGVTCGSVTTSMVCQPTLRSQKQWGLTMTARKGVTLIPYSYGSEKDGLAVFFRPRAVIVYDMASDDIVFQRSQP